jgi:uncharacterized protein YdaU (DUF1376 family)
MPERGNKAKLKQIWMPLYVGDYLAETQLFTTEQHGAYNLIRMAYWDNRGPIPDDDVVLAAITRAPVSRWKKIKRLVLSKFESRDGELHNSDLDALLERATKLQVEASEKGKKGARARWSDGQNGNAPANAPANATGNAPAYASQSQSHNTYPYQGESSRLEVTSGDECVDQDTGEITGFGGAA